MFKFQALKFLSVGLLLISSAAVAATTGNVALSGSVSTTLNLDVTDADNDGLDLTDAGQHIVNVAALEMTTNNDQGLTLTVTSGSLSKTGGQDIDFQVTTVDSGAGIPAAGAFTVASGVNYQVGSILAGELNKDLYIMYSSVASQDPGDYVGDIGLTVADNG